MKTAVESTKYFFKQVAEIRKWALIAAAFFMVAYTFWDMYRFSDLGASKVISIRVLFMILPLLILISFLYMKEKWNLNRKTIDWVAFIAVIFVGWGHAQIVEIAAYNDVYFPKSGLAIILMYSSLMLALPILLSAASSVIIVFIALHAYNTTGLVQNELVSTGFFYFVFASCCLLMNYVCLKILMTNHKLVNIIKEQANTDELTGLQNRRYFYFHGAQLHQHSARNNKSLALLLLDLDNFKIINDKLGHKYGDKVLEKCSDVFKSQVSKSFDMVARLGGDEFVILLYDTDEFQLNSVCKSIISSIDSIANQIRTKLPNSDFGISIGVATNDVDENYPIETLLEMADKALYQVKHQNKNSFTVLDKSLYDQIGQSSAFLPTL